MPNRAWLVDERWEKAYPIGTALSIGRGPDNAVILRDPSVSRVHATITAEPDGFVLRSTGAVGTAVNGRPSEHAVLGEGDRIAIASSTLRFTHQEPDEEMMVVPHDRPVSLDRLAPATRAFPVPHPAEARAFPVVPVMRLALAFVLGSLLILLALR